MTGLRKLVAAAGVVAAVGIAVWAPAKPPQGGDAAAIRTLEQNWAKAFETKSADAIMKFYQPGPNLIVFDVMPPGQYAGYGAYKKDWESFYASFDGPVKMKITNLAVGTSGNLAYSHSFQTVSGKGKDGKPKNITVRVTDVYREMGGKWLIVHEHVSVPVDLNTLKPDLQSSP